MRTQKKTLHQLWFYESFLVFQKLRKFPSTALNLSLTYNHLSNLMKKTAKKVTQKVGCENVSIWASEYFFLFDSVSNVCIFYFAVLFFNLPGFMHLLRRFIRFLTFIASEISFLYIDLLLFLLQYYIIFHCQFG